MGTPTGGRPVRAGRDCRGAAERDQCDHVLILFACLFDRATAFGRTCPGLAAATPLRARAPSRSAGRPRGHPRQQPPPMKPPTGAGREAGSAGTAYVGTTMFGADYAKGPLCGRVAVAQPGARRVRRAGRRPGALLGDKLLPVTRLPSDRPHHGVGRGRLRRWRRLLTPQGGPALESGLSTKMAAAGTRGELGAGGASGFELTCKADPLWVGGHRRRGRPGRTPGGDRGSGDALPDGRGWRARGATGSPAGCR